MARKGIWMKRAGNALVPADEAATEALSKLKPGKLLLVSSQSPRNPSQHRLFWHLCDLIQENSDQFVDREHVAEQIKIGTGRVSRTRYKVPDIGWVEQVRGLSISYGSMPQEEFQEWFKRVLDYVVTDLLPGVNRGDIKAELEAYAYGQVGGSAPSGNWSG